MAQQKVVRLAHTLENWIDRFRPRRGDGPLLIEAFIGYSDDHHVVLRGRVLEEGSLRRLSGLAERLGTAGAMARYFLTSEVANVEIACGSDTTHSDEEGYFNLRVPANRVDGGIAEVVIRASGDTFELPVSLTPENATRGVISDIDDTIIETGAWQLARNLWTTFTSSAEERTVFEDTAEILRRKQALGEPVFYVSSSPWNLHPYLMSVFEGAEVPVGPIFLRDFGVDKGRFNKSSHGSHKGDAIDTILAANPALTFTLIGDTGQHDAQIYLDAIKRHEGRIDEVYLRRAGRIDEKDQQAAEAIRATGVAFHSGETLG